MSATICRPAASNWWPAAPKRDIVTGLSATVTRKDGHHPIIFMQCGPVRYRVDARRQAAARPFTHHVLVRPTGFPLAGHASGGRDGEFQRSLRRAGPEASRAMQLICADVIAGRASGSFPLVLTERTEHLRLLADALSAEVGM